MTVKKFSRQEGRFKVEAKCQKLGADFLVWFYGGAAHIGAVAIAQPRASLKNPAQLSATASVFCYPGHKEDEVVKYVAEKLSAALNAKVVVSAGMHWEELTSEGIATIMNLVTVLTLEIIEHAEKLQEIDKL